MKDVVATRAAFQKLHEGFAALPAANAGHAGRLASLGFRAIASTSHGLTVALGNGKTQLRSTSQGAENWIRAPERKARRPRPSDGLSARLTMDVTADMLGRIKIAAFQRGQTVADMLRALFAREFPPP